MSVTKTIQTIQIQFQMSIIFPIKSIESNIPQLFHTNISSDKFYINKIRVVYYITKIKQFHNIIINNPSKHQTYKKQTMADVSDSRVQFFNSQSSFGSSSSVSYSRIQFANDELLSDTEEIFSTLQQVLIPRQDLVDKIQLDHIIHRARILANQTIPQHVTRLNKNNRSSHSQLIMVSTKCQEKLRRLVNDYDSYTHERLSYEDLYNLYGRQLKNAKDFSKKKQARQFQLCNNIQPDIVNIIQSAPPKALQHMPKNTALQQKYMQQDKQIKRLQDQLQISKKRQKNLALQYQAAFQQLKKQSNQRILHILSLCNISNKNNKDSVDATNTLKACIEQNNTQLLKQIKTNQQHKNKIQQLQKQIQNLQNRNRILQIELASTRRVSSSRASQHNRSDYSKYSQDGVDENVRRKMQKQIKNLQYQSNLLKNQLKKQRELTYRYRKIQQNVQDSEIKNLKKMLQDKSNQLRQTKFQLDKYKIQSIKLTDQLQKSQKSTQLAKFQANNQPYLLSNRYSAPNNNNPINMSSGNNFYPASNQKDMNKLDQSRTTKYSIGTYIGDGNQNYPYYQFLNKQFKIRFRRSCLKEKQLLYKANGLQIGTISQFIQPNQIKINVHISNFCDQQHIKNLSLKIVNSKNNKIFVKNTIYPLLEIGQQIKTVVTAHIKYLPLGCTVLLCQYDYYDKHEQVRVLLPVHIFKMLTFKPRDNPFISANKLTIPSQRKIAKDAATICTYFKGAKLQNNTIKLLIYHQQSQTKLLCDITSKSNEIVIQYQHRSGEQSLSQYIVKTLTFLLKKEENI